MRCRPLVLTQALWVSGGLNIVLLGFFFYLMVTDRPLFEERPKVARSIQVAEMESTIAACVESFESLTQEQLVPFLQDTSSLDEGYRVRDLALSLLVQDHDFDLDRALEGFQKPRQIRTLKVASNLHPARVIHLFPGLRDEQFFAIYDFAKQEAWPLTPVGLFQRLKAGENHVGLQHAFSLTPPFLALKSLFAGTPLHFPESTLMAFALTLDWEELERVGADCASSCSLDDVRQTFLLSKRSPLLLETDWNFAIKRLSDAECIQLLEQLDPEEELTQNFARELLISPRSNEVLEEAASLLYAQAEELNPFNHFEAVRRFVPESETIEVRNAESLYIVQEGDSLWKISREHQIDLDRLKSLNGLHGDSLHPGQVLEIPIY